MYKKNIFYTLMLLYSFLKGDMPMLVVSKDAQNGVIYFSPDKEVSDKLLGAKMMYGGHDPTDIELLKKEHPGKIFQINFAIQMIDGKPTLIEK